MLGNNPLSLDDLIRLCQEQEEESSSLDFKACDALKFGHKPKNPRQTDSKEEMLDELSKDVSAFLNAAGGIIIYGIRENASRADRLDEENAFRANSKADNISPERVSQWLGSHIQPQPPVNVYSILAKPGEVDSPWYLVIDIQAGETAYMARDGRYYRRVGIINTKMEHYEVVDVMNRTRAASLEIRVEPYSLIQMFARLDTLGVNLAITSMNFIASEQGAFRITVAKPALLREASLPAALKLNNGYVIKNAQTYNLVRWGATTGNIIFPGDWLTFNILIDIPSTKFLTNPTFLFQIELYTLNSSSKKRLYSVRLPQPLTPYNEPEKAPHKYVICNEDTADLKQLIAAYEQTVSASQMFVAGE